MQVDLFTSAPNSPNTGPWQVYDISPVLSGKVKKTEDGGRGVMELEVNEGNIRWIQKVYIWSLLCSYSGR